MEYGPEADQMTTIAADIYIARENHPRTRHEKEIHVWMNLRDVSRGAWIKDELLKDDNIKSETQNEPHWGLFLVRVKPETHPDSDDDDDDDDDDDEELPDAANGGEDQVVQFYGEPVRLRGSDYLSQDTVKALLASEVQLELRPADPLQEELQRGSLNNQPFNVSIVHPINGEPVELIGKTLNITLPATDIIDAALQDARTPVEVRTAMGRWNLFIKRQEEFLPVPNNDPLNHYISSTTEEPDAILFISLPNKLLGQEGPHGSLDLGLQFKPTS